MSLVRSEMLKLLSTRTVYGLIAGAVAVVLLGTVSTIMSADPNNLGGPLHEQSFYIVASINIGLFALVLGIRTFTDEFRHGTIVMTLLAGGSRVRVVAAKLTVVAAAAVVMAVVAVAAMAAAAVALSSARGAVVDVTSADAAALAGMVGAMALWATIGGAVGAVVRHQVAAIVGGLIWVLVIENLGSALLGDLGRYLPGQAAHALAAAPIDGLTVPAGTVVMVAYAAAAMFGAGTAFARRDIA